MSLAVALALLAPAWVPTQARWSAQELPVPYCITANATNTNASSTEQRQAILSAIQAWTSVGSGGSVSCTTYAVTPANYTCSPGVDGRDRRFNISWTRNWTNGSTAIGVTWTTGTGRSCGSVTNDRGTTTSLQCKYDSDIEFNDQNYRWTVSTTRPSTDIESIAVHEYGHFLGLGHCSDNGTCGLGTGVMNASYAGGTVRVPFTDDIEGVCGLYPGSPGGLGYPCQNGSQCSSGLCIGPSGSRYCTQTCGSCPSGYVCDANPGNPNQRVCVRDNGLDRDLCETCQLETPGACANNGLCIRGIPENDVGRCVVPCGAGNSCPTDYACYQVQFQGGGTANYCFPRSNDCTDLGNFTELELGQRCDGSQPCADGLTCVGICAPSCARGEACPNGWACEDGFEGSAAFCLPAVGEGQDCSGLVTCAVGPCLSEGGQSAVCFLDCEGNPEACNNAQACNAYNLQGGGRVSICEPPGVPPLPPDAGVITPDSGPTDPPDAGDTPPDAGMSPPDSGMSGPTEKPENACACDTTFQCDGDGTGAVCSCDLECGCTCDRTYACDPGCGACDPECSCACDRTFACDPGCEICDPECEDATCTCTSVAVNRKRGPLPLALGAALLTLGLFRRRRR